MEEIFDGIVKIFGSFYTVPLVIVLLLALVLVFFNVWDDREEGRQMELKHWKHRKNVGDTKK